MIGSRLGTYEITAKLGEGGMGEVYRATDSRLKREVAIKVLPAAFTEDKERLARFEREAQLLAQLNHPNIAQIYGMETSGATHALVMELVPGPTLAERLESGPLSFAESLTFALQIALALEEAHEKGIVHRDLKPQNVKASSEGKAKVLDFGLAKAMDAGASSRFGGGSRALADDHELADAHRRGDRTGHAARRHSRHRGLHGARAGARRDRRQARRHLGLRCRLLRDADRQGACSRARPFRTLSPRSCARKSTGRRCPRRHRRRSGVCSAAASSATRRAACATSATRASRSTR